MAERIPQSTTKLVVFKAYLSSDHVTPATGKTIAITISKNGATSFSNPNAGATNATEMASGYYKFTLDTTDTGTKGPLAYRAAGTDVDDVGDVFEVVNATNAGFTALPDTACTTNASLITSGTGTAQIKLASGYVAPNWGDVGNPTTTVGLSGTTIKTATDVETDTADIQTRLPAALVSGRMDSSVGAMAANVVTAAAIADGAIDAATFAAGALDAVWSTATRVLTAGTNIVLAKGVGVTGFNDITAASVWAADLTGIFVGGSAGDYMNSINTNVGDIETQIGAAGAGLTALASAANLATVAGYLDTEIAAIKAKTDNLPADPAGLAGLASAHGAGSWATATGFAVAGDAMTLTAAYGAAGQLKSNILYVNSIQIDGAGTSANPWGPV